MNAEVDRYYAINKFFLSQLGIWPYQHKVQRVLLPCLLTAIQYSTIASSMLLLYDTWGDVDIAIEIMFTVPIFFIGNVKLINLVVKNDKFRRLLEYVNDDWKFFNSESERLILKHYATIGQKMTKYYAIFGYTAVIPFFLMPLVPRILDVVIPLNESRPLKYVYAAEYRVDKEKYYYQILFHSYISYLVNISSTITIDSMLAVLVLHICSLFVAIGHRLENIVGGIDTRLYTDEKTHISMQYHLFMEKYDRSVNDDYHELIMCLKKHQFALEQAQILDSMFTHLMFAILCMTIMVMSVIGIQILNELDYAEVIVKNSLFFIGILIHLMYPCYSGQLLMDQSAELFNKTYGSQWYTFSIKSRQLLRILLYRSFVPCTLSAGKMFIMSMSMCSSVMQTAMSYFTAFLSMR